MRLVGVGVGGFIEIAGKKSTVVPVFRLDDADEGKKVIRIDRLVRKNASANLGDRIIIRKADVRPAKVVAFAPVMKEGHKISFGPGIENFVKRGLLRRPMRKGDLLTVPGIALMDGALPFKTLRTSPGGNVQVVSGTKVAIHEGSLPEGKVLPPEALVDRLVTILSELFDEYGEVLTVLQGDARERARAIHSKLRAIVEELRKRAGA